MPVPLISIFVIIENKNTKYYINVISTNTNLIIILTIILIHSLFIKMPIFKYKRALYTLFKSILIRYLAATASKEMSDFSPFRCAFKASKSDFQTMVPGANIQMLPF
jgi:hypothetical protein